MVRGFLFDLAWASRAGSRSTGNSLRSSLKLPPGVGMTNLYLQPGQGGLDELAAGLDRGLVVTEVMGMHTADPVSGEFSLGASGHLVEAGRITRPVKSIALAGNLLDLFKSVEAIGGDLRFWLPGLPLAFGFRPVGKRRLGFSTAPSDRPGHTPTTTR